MSSVIYTAKNFIIYFLDDPLTTFPNAHPTSSLPRIRRVLFFFRDLTA